MKVGEKKCPGVGSPLSTAGPMHICYGAAMAPLYRLAKRGTVRVNGLRSSYDLKAWPDSSDRRVLDEQKVRGREFESRSGRLYSHTFTFHIDNYSLTG